jgi:hypothetical protein
MKISQLFAVNLIVILAFADFAVPGVPKPLANRVSKKESKNISCALTLKSQDSALGFVPKLIELIKVSSADGHARWDLTLKFETYSSDEQGKRVAISESETALLEYSCLQSSCFAITRPADKIDHSRTLTLLYFKNFPKPEGLRKFVSEAVVIGRNPYALYVDVPVDVTAKCEMESVEPAAKSSAAF